jgi:hypothetical protein
MLTARKTSVEAGELRFVTRSILDGRPVDLDGLAERLNAAFNRNDAGDSSTAQTASESRSVLGVLSHEERLAERLKRAEERMGWTENPETMP